MARTDNEVRVTTSVLDRLLDFEPDISREAIPSRSKNLRQLKEAVRRDLEWLLNTRQVAGGLPDDLEELNNSLAAYGLPDFTNANLQSVEDQKRVQQEIEDLLKIFEPRLEGVSVTFQLPESNERLIHFRIDAHLKVEPSPEPITFDTMLHPGTTQYVVKEK
jgi:type VI secretion system protein ImpF